MLPALMAFTSVLLAAAALRAPRRVVGVGALARQTTLDSRELALEADGRAPMWERLVRPLIHALASRLQPRWAGLSADDLRKAGLDTDRYGVAEVLAIKVLAALMTVAFLSALALTIPFVTILIPGAGFAAFVAPSIVVRRRRAHRRAQMLRELPDLVGLLKAFVTAGVPMEQALHLISAQQARQQPPNLLAVEIRKALSQYGLGLTIDEALETMAVRTGLEELELLAAALSQGKRQGAGMERILRDQEAVVRMHQRNRATAEASKVSTRLVGVLVFIYLPEFMVLIMVPLFYGIFLRAFS